MREIAAVLVDDEPLARRGIAQLLDAHGDVRIVGEARDGREAVVLIRTLEPDLVFLDIQMPELDGFAVLERLPIERRPVVVFLTAHEEYAIRGFDVAAVDYLLKPPPQSRFDACMLRVRTEIERRRGDAAGGRRSREEFVLVEKHGEEHLLRPGEIDWIEASDYYAAIHAHGRRYLRRESLDSLEQRLPGTLFMRVHRSALVNLARIVGLAGADAGGGMLELRNGDRVPVSRRRRSAVRDWLRTRDGKGAGG